MKLLDYIIAIFYLPLSKFKRKGLEGGILLATLPLTFLLVALIFYLLHLLFPAIRNIYNIFTYGFIAGVAFLITNRTLHRLYLSRYEYINGLVNNFKSDAIRILMILFAFFFYALSVFVVSYSFRFT